MLQIFPIAKTQIDWQLFLTLTSKFLGRSVTKTIDHQSFNLKDSISYLIAFSEFEEELNGVPSDFECVLKHFNFSFLVLCSKDLLLEVSTASDLKISFTESISEILICSIISGNLQEWRTAIINGTSDRSTFIVRNFFDKIFLEFDKLGLGCLWSKYSKIQMSDSTFRLK